MVLASSLLTALAIASGIVCAGLLTWAVDTMVRGDEDG